MARLHLQRPQGPAEPDAPQADDSVLAQYELEEVFVRRDTAMRPELNEPR